MDIIEKIILSLCLSLIGSLIMLLIEKKNVRNKKKLRWILIGITVLAIILALLLVPPYRISHVTWNLQKNGSILAKGKLTRTVLFLSPVFDYPVQVKIFKLGTPKEGAAVKDAVFGRTDADGIFSVEFPPPQPPAGQPYLINMAYKHGGDTWEISDFPMGDLKP